MRLIQLNIWHGRLLLNLTRFLEKNPADILCLQEVFSNEDTHEFFFNNLQKLQRQLDYPHVHFAPTVDFATGDATTFFGNAILSKYPIEPVATVFTSGAYRSGFSFKNRDKLPWNFHHVTLDAGGKKTHIINHHGFWVDGPKTGNAETMRQMHMIADYIDTLAGPVIFAGDLNLWPEAESLQRFNARLRNLVAESGVTTTRNFTSFKPVEICDYIYVNDNVAVEGFRVHDDVVSDHSMLELDFA